MQIIRHPFVERDILGMVHHVPQTSEEDDAALHRRLDELDTLLHDILEDPTSGLRLRGQCDSWLVRHGGSEQPLTVVFRPDIENDCIYLAMVALGA